MRIWKISPGKGGRYWDHFRDREMMAIGWLYDLGDLNKYETSEEIRSIALRLGNPDRGGRSRIKQIIDFKYSEENDIVVAFGKQSILDIGLINGCYYHVDEEKYNFEDNVLYCHRKSILWLNIFSSIPLISDHLLKKLRYPQSSIHEITDMAVQKEIFRYLSEKGLSFIDGNIYIDEEKYEYSNMEPDYSRSKLDMHEIYKQALNASRKPLKYYAQVNQIARNPFISFYVKLRAKGVCDLCGEEGPFLDRHGVPFLETHHIVWLSEGGEDSINNAVALCPNCHRKMHIVKSVDDISYLQNKVKILGKKYANLK